MAAITCQLRRLLLPVHKHKTRSADEQVTRCLHIRRLKAVDTALRLHPQVEAVHQQRAAVHNGVDAKALVRARADGRHRVPSFSLLVLSALSVSQLDGGFYPENRRPDFLTVSHEAYLISSGLLEYRTLVSPGKEPEYPDGESSIHVSFIGFREMALFEKEISEKKHQMIQFAITAFLAFLAVPGVIEGVIRIIEFFSKP